MRQYSVSTSVFCQQKRLQTSRSRALLSRFPLWPTVDIWWSEYLSQVSSPSPNPDMLQFVSLLPPLFLPHYTGPLPPFPSCSMQQIPSPPHVFTKSYFLQKCSLLPIYSLLVTLLWWNLSSLIQLCFHTCIHTHWHKHSYMVNSGKNTHLHIPSSFVLTAHMIPFIEHQICLYKYETGLQTLSFFSLSPAGRFICRGDTFFCPYENQAHIRVKQQ